VNTLSEWTASDAKPWIRIPTESDNKYTHGVLGVVTGSEKYPGAAVLGVEAAHHTGIGMVRYLGPESVAQLVMASRPEIVTALVKVDAWLVGSGIDPGEIKPAERDLILQAVTSEQPVVMDAGALSFLPETTSPAIITPHEGELERILPRHKNSLDEWAARAAALLGVVVVLKGHTTWIASPSDGNSETFLKSVTTSTTWLATAGTGDVLAGTIAAVLATQSSARSEEDPLTLVDLAAVAATGVFLHSMAAGKASEEGPFPALDVAHCLSQSVKELTG
jgi:hydroxyethylthiazole kinase-like uncharacterized protein yjeF